MALGITSNRPHNYRMTELQAALGVSQMTRIDEFVDRRHELAARYDRLFAHRRPSAAALSESRSALHLYSVQVRADRQQNRRWRKHCGKTVSAPTCTTSPSAYPTLLPPTFRLQNRRLRRRSLLCGRNQHSAVFRADQAEQDEAVEVLSGLSARASKDKRLPENQFSVKFLTHAYG